MAARELLDVEDEARHQPGQAARALIHLAAAGWKSSKICISKRTWLPAVVTLVLVPMMLLMKRPVAEKGVRARASRQARRAPN